MTLHTAAYIADMGSLADMLAELRDQAPWSPPAPRSPHPRAPHTFVTTPAFLEHWGLNSLADLPELDRLRDDGLLSKAAIRAAQMEEQAHEFLREAAE